MSSKVLGWRTRIYILYTSTYPTVLDTTVWAKPLKVSQSDLRFGFAYWHKLESMREEWNTYDMVGVVAADQCSSAYIAHISKALTDDTLLKTGYHQFTINGISRKYSPLFQRVLNKHCKPPLSSNTKTTIYNAWICSPVKMARFMDWFSTKLTPFVSTNPINFEEMVTIGDTMKVNDEPAPYTLITTMLVEKLIMGYFAVDRIDDKMNVFYTNDYARESKRLEQHEQLKLKFVKSVESLPKPVLKAVTPTSEEPVPVRVPNIIERMQEEYRVTQAAREQLEAEEMAARSILAEEMKKKAIKESELLATLQKTMVVKSTKGTAVTSEIASADANTMRQKIDGELYQERIKLEAETETHRRVVDEELAVLRRKAEEEMVSSIRTAELDSIRQIQQQTNASVTRIRAETERKVAIATATLEREKMALERAKVMRLELETSRDAAIREAEDAVHQMRTIEKETRKYAHLLEQANSSRKRYEAERVLLVKQIDVEMTYVRSSIEHIEKLHREKEERIRISRRDAEERMRKASAKAEEEAAEARKQTEFDVIAERQRRDKKVQEEIRQKEDDHLAEKRREDADLEVNIKAKWAEYLQQKKLEDARVLTELKEKEAAQVRERDKQLEQFAIEKRKSDEEFARDRIALLQRLQVEHEHALKEVKVLTADAEKKCDDLKSELTQLHASKDAVAARMSDILTEMNATTITSTRLEEDMFSMRLRISDMTETIYRLTRDTKAIQPKLDQLTATKATTLEEYEMYQLRLETLTEETDIAVANLAIIEKETTDKQTQRQHVEQQHREMLDEIHAHTVAISIAEQTIAAIKSNMSSLIVSKASAEQSMLEMRIHIEEHRDRYEECESRRRIITDELAATLAILTTEQGKLTNSERNLTERRQQLQTIEGQLEVLRLEYDRSTFQLEEATFKHTTITEQNAELNQNIRQISDAIQMLNQSYAEMVKINHTLTEQQMELRNRNTAENRILVEKRADLVELEKAYSSDHDMRKMTEETYQMAIAEHETVVAHTKQLMKETIACRKEKSDLEQQSTAIISAITILEHELLEIRATTLEQETTLARLAEEKEAATRKSAEYSSTIARSQFEERIRISLNEKVAAKRRALDEYQELLHAQSHLNLSDKTALARKRAIDEALAARNHIEQNPVRIYILCHNVERFERAESIYKKYPWACPILMKYQDCTFENAVWKQLYEIRDEWYNYKMVGTMSFSSYTKINLNDVDRVIKDPNTWAAGFYHFMRTETPISNKHHPHLVEIMTDTCKALELSVPPENFCNYWITSSEKMIQFLIWFEERAYPIVMSHPLIMTDSTYPGSLSKDKLLTLCGVPYYPHTPFVFERLFLSYFASLK